MKRSEKRKNHEVSRFLLLNWLDASAQPPRIHYFDLNDYRLKSEVGKKANFAVTEYIYTPLVEPGKRIEEFEDFLSFDECALGSLSKAAHSGLPDMMPTDGDFVARAIRGCIALGFRNAYSFYLLTRIPGLLNTAVLDTTHQALVENCMNAIQAKSRLVEQHNHFVVETARQWVVGNKSDVSRYAADLSFEHVQRRRALDQYVFFDPTS